ncbi:MAG TPA: succinylglutamate desuccinylase/aspartoacylase family protein [Stellaceae bacterium]|nr:succinylglutamate desuccinylase/aspartoacylase family protein [Stellaceae bacterium]
MSNRRSKISIEIDLAANGKHTGYLRLPHSVHRSAYGFLAMPIVSIRNGTGPRVLLTSGNHGDEYEGQVVLTKLARMLAPENISGQVIIVPMLNFPAAAAGMRTSPIDDGNLNRVFPGDPDGRPTWMIAHFVETVLMPEVDYSMDLHSGGSSLIYVPGTLARRVDDKKTLDKILELVRAFGAPNCYLMSGGTELGTGGILSAAERAGIIGVSAELGGAGMVTPATLAITERGVRNVLSHLGVLAEKVDAHPTRIMQVDRAAHYAYAYDSGLFEPRVELGDNVRKGDLAGVVVFPDEPWREPAPVHFRGDGVVVCKRVPARVERGDCVYHLASDVKL